MTDGVHSDPDGCICRCDECGDWIEECACDDLEVEHECDCWGESS